MSRYPTVAPTLGVNIMVSPALHRPCESASVNGRAHVPRHINSHLIEPRGELSHVSLHRELCPAHDTPPAPRCCCGHARCGTCKFLLDIDPRHGKMWPKRKIQRLIRVAAAVAAAVTAAQLPVMVDVKPGVWLMRVRGDSSFGGDTFKLDETMGIDSLNAAFRGELTIQHTDWAVKLMGTTINAGGSVQTTGGTWGGIGLTAGDETSFDMSWLQFEGHWTAWTLLGDGRRDTNEALDLSFGPHLAVSWIDIEEKLTSTATGVSTTASGGWWSVMGGAQLSMQADMRKLSSWLYQMRVDVSGHVGTTIDRGGFAWAVQGGAHHDVHPQRWCHCGVPAHGIQRS